jgi:peptidylprolyl isomerase
MAKAKIGDKVKINYIGKLENGTIFDSTMGHGHEKSDCSDEECGCSGGPAEIVLGEGEMFPQIDEALAGMVPGEKKSVIIQAGTAFFAYDNDQVFTILRSDMPDDLQPAVGDELVIASEGGEEIEVSVLEVCAESVTFDANHPLAGKDLFFDIELLEILQK